METAHTEQFHHVLYDGHWIAACLVDHLHEQSRMDNIELFSVFFRDLAQDIELAQGYIRRKEPGGGVLLARDVEAVELCVGELTEEVEDPNSEWALELALIQGERRKSIPSARAYVGNGEIWAGDINARVQEISHVLLPDVMLEAQTGRSRDIAIEAIWIRRRRYRVTVGLGHCNIERDKLKLNSICC